MFFKIGIAFIFLTSSAFGADIIYTWGYGRVFNDLLLGIANIIASANSMLLVAAGIGFMFLVYKIMADPKSNPIVDVVRFLFTQILFYFSPNIGFSRNQPSVHS